jgi:OmpA-OmpF porin, OOP family
VCPTLPGSAINKGCPVMSMEDQKVITDAISNVNFKTASAELEPASFAVLDQVASVLLKYPHYKLSIEGHTDSQGDDALNLRLSRERAKACFDHLLKDGVPASRMTASGLGETRPVASNDTEEGRRQNRRVEFNLNIE